MHYTFDFKLECIEGEFIYIKEREANIGNAYYMDREFFSIDKNEFHYYLSVAKSNAWIENAIKNHDTTLEELEQLDH